MAVAFDAASSGKAVSAASLTISHTIGAGSDRALYAACHGSDRTFTATYNGSAMTELYDGSPGSPFQFIAVYRLIEVSLPSTGAYNIVFTPDASVTIAGCGVSYTGVDQTTPNDAIDIATGTGTAVSNAVASASGDLVIDFISANEDQAATVGADQTARVNFGGGDDFRAIYSSEEAGAASVTMSWTLATSRNWTAAGLNLNVAAAAGRTTKNTRAHPLGVEHGMGFRMAG